MKSTQAFIDQGNECGIGRAPSDRQLLDSYIERHDEAAFAGLVERHAGSVWRVCRRVLHRDQDAEDAFQAAFVVLARKAASIRTGQAMGSWLHSVAYRIAAKARQDLFRRRDGEKRATIAPASPPPWSEASCRELQRLLDEEVQRLPEKYRSPFVLCCLEGMSKAEAAAELNWKEGTVSGRLARARKLLQTRLARRGIALSAVLTVIAVTQNSLQAAAPTLAIQAAVQAAMPAAAGQVSALSPAALALAENFVRATVVAKLKAGLAALLALTLAMAGTGFAAFFLGAGALPPPPDLPTEGEIFLAPPVAFIQSIDEQVLSLAFSPDSKRLVTAGARFAQPGQLKIWDAETHAEWAAVREIRGVRSVAFAPNGKTIATGDFGGAVRLRDAQTGEELTMAAGHKVGVNGVAFSSAGKSLVSAGLDRVVKLWDLPGLTVQKAFHGHTDMVHSVAFFRHGEAFVTCGRDKTAIIWDIRSGQAKSILRGHGEWVEMAAISPDDKVVATASFDRTIRLWNADTGTQFAVLEDKKGAFAPSAVYAVAFSPKEELLASASADGSVHLWDLKTQQHIALLGKHGQGVWSVAFSHDGKKLASGSSDTTAKIWDVAGRKEIATLATSLRQPIQAIAYAPDGQLVATATGDRTPQIRDARTGILVVRLRGHTDMVTCLAYSPDGQTVATGGLDRKVILWDASTGNQRRTLDGHAGPVHSLTFTPDGKKLASAGDDKVVKLWDTTSGKSLAEFNGHEAAIRALACAPDGDSLASGADKTVMRWSLAQKAKASTLPGHDGNVRALAFSKSGLLASAGDDGTVKLWEPGQEKARLTLNGHKGEVRSIAFTPSGGTLLSGGADASIIMWDPGNGKPRGTLPASPMGGPRLATQGHHDAVTALAIHPQGSHLLTGSADTKILRWQRPFSLEPPLPLLFHQNLRGENMDEKWLTYVPLDGRPQMKTEPQGLRISLPAKDDKRVPTGLRSKFRLQGDFDITLSFELLQAPRPIKGNGIGVSIYVTTDTPTHEAVMIGRFNRVEGSLYTCSKMTTDVKGKRQFTGATVPTDTQSGKLRLVRLGRVVKFLVADENSSAFREIHQHELGQEDVSYIRIAAEAGNADSPALEVRFHEFEVRAHGELAKLSQPKVAAPTAIPKAVPKKTYAQEYFEPFKGAPDKRIDIARLGAGTAETVKFEPAGLRITLPPTEPTGHPAAGVEIPLVVQGDFEITLDFEVLQEPDPAKTGKEPTRFTLDAGVDRKTSTGVTLSRRTVTDAGPQFFAWMSLLNEVTGKYDKRGLGIPGKSRTGRLRLVRDGATISYYAAESRAADFILVSTYPFVDRDLENLVIVALTGGPQAALDVRFTHLHVRADAIPNLRADPSQAAPRDLSGTEPDTKDARKGLLTVAVLVGVLVLASGIGIAFLLVRRRRGASVANESKDAQPAPKVALTSSLVFACSHCKKKLKTNGNCEGKKVKCPHCGRATPAQA